MKKIVVTPTKKPSIDATSQSKRSSTKKVVTNDTPTKKENQGISSTTKKGKKPVKKEIAAKRR